MTNNSAETFIAENLNGITSQCVKVIVEDNACGSSAGQSGLNEARHRLLDYDTISVSTL